MLTIYDFKNRSEKDDENRRSDENRRAMRIGIDKEATEEEWIKATGSYDLVGSSKQN